MGLNIAVLIKVSPDPEQYDKIQLDPETNTLIRTGIDSVISTTDLYAIETALQVKEKFGGEITLISMGPDSIEKQMREGLGYGCDRAVILSDRKFGGADALATSYTLAKGVEKTGPFDLIFLGNASDDGATAHVPTQVGEFLGLPHITDISSFEMESESEATVKREISGGINTYRVALPCIVGVTRQVAEVRHPSVMGILQAKNKPLDIYAAEDFEDIDESRLGLVGSPTSATGYVDAGFSRDCEEIVGDSDEEKAAEIFKIVSQVARA